MVGVGSGPSGRIGRRIVVLAPMPIELTAIRRRLGLATRDDHRCEGVVGDASVVAVLAGVGPDPSAAVARELIASERPDHVVVAGVAGGIGPEVRVGDLVVPAEVVDLDGGGSYPAHGLGGAVLAGRLVMAGALITDRSVLEGHAADGVLAIDMETAAVAAVCEEADVPWTAFRGISDHFREGLIGDATMGLMHADGTPDLGAVARYVARRPANVAVLRRLARDTGTATRAAAAALRAALEAP